MPTRDEWLEKAGRAAAVAGAHAEAHDAADSFVAEGYAALRDEGLFAALVPAEFGGGDASAGDMCAVIRAIGASCGATALAFSMHSHLVAVAAWRWRHQQAPVEGLLRAVAGGAVLVSSGGSDWLDSGGVAVPAEGGFRITARKPFSSGVPGATLLSTSAVLDDPQAGPTVLHFAVPLDAPGVRIVENWRVMGMRGTGSNEILLEDVFVAEAAIAGRRPRGPWHPLFHAIAMIALPLIYSAYVGLAEGARERALALVKGRATDPALIAAAGRMDNALASALLAHERMAWLADHGTPGPEATLEATTLRTLAGEAAIATVERAMALAGGAGFYRAKGLERAFRDVQAARYHPLQEPAQLAYSGRMALGLDIDG